MPVKCAKSKQNRPAYAWYRVPPPLKRRLPVIWVTRAGTTPLSLLQKCQQEMGWFDCLVVKITS
jgi:hypothetical protein